MKCEGFGYITDLVDYLDNNRLIAYYCGFDIPKPLPSYRTYDRFLRRLNHKLVEKVMQSQVKKLYEMGVLDASSIGLDSTPIMANTRQNNPKSFAKNKFDRKPIRQQQLRCRGSILFYEAVFGGDTVVVGNIAVILVGHDPVFCGLEHIVIEHVVDAYGRLPLAILVAGELDIGKLHFR